MSQLYSKVHAKKTSGCVRTCRVTSVEGLGFGQTRHLGREAVGGVGGAQGSYSVARAGAICCEYTRLSVSCRFFLVVLLLWERRLLLVLPLSSAAVKSFYLSVSR